MFFHIDESGNTGNNLFDVAQPRLSYGLLSSKTNVDALGRSIHRRMLAEVGEPSLHANHLGVDRLTRIAPLLMELQRKMGFTLDYYFIDKQVYALTLLFDSVFDAGLNPAVGWFTYWTPLRFVLIHKLGSILDVDLLKEAWRLCTHRHIQGEGASITRLLTVLKERSLASALDGRTKEVLSDAFSYGIEHPLELDFGTADNKIISPNAVCFQFIVSAMARRLRKSGLKDASSITVDQQAQFNGAQISTYFHQKLIAEGMRKASAEERRFMVGHPLFSDVGSDEVLLKGIPQADIRISSSDRSIGLQIVDTYLWIANRLMQGSDLSAELRYLGSLFFKRGFIDGISLEGMERRFLQFAEHLPAVDRLSENQIEFAKRAIADHRVKVKALGI